EGDGEIRAVHEDGAAVVGRRVVVGERAVEHVQRAAEQRDRTTAVAAATVGFVQRERRAVADRGASGKLEHTAARALGQVAGERAVVDDEGAVLDVDAATVAGGVGCAV